MPNIAQRLNDYQRRLDAQEEILSQVVVTIAEMSAALELVTGSLLDSMDETGAEQFIARFEAGRAKVFDFMAKVVNDNAHETSLDHATMDEVARRVQAADTSSDS